MTAYEEMSSLVNYIQPIKFESFEISARKNDLFSPVKEKFFIWLKQASDIFALKMAYLLTV